jgi:tetratricopeptide (TPR) repeat protein
MKLKNTLLLWSFSFLGTFCFAQTVKQTLGKADSLCHFKDYINAEVLYERVLFFTDSTFIMETYIKTALCKVALNKYNEAADLYKLASNTTTSDTLYYSFLLKQSLCLIMDKQYEEAQKTLEEINTEETPKYYLQKALFQNAMVEANNLNFEKAKIDFSKCSQLLTESDQELIQNLIKQNIKSTNIHSTRAGFYSAVIPGLGQTFSGDYKNGINSFVLNAGFLTAFIYTGNQYNYLSSLLFYSFFFPRFYLGGISSAKSIATQKLATEKRNYFNNYLKIYLKY